MKNNRIKKHILEFIAAALLLMAIVGASKYQQKEAQADPSTSDGKSAVSTESTDNKTALTTSGTEDNKTESKPAESSTETPANIETNASTNLGESAPATNTSNTTSNIENKTSTSSSSNAETENKGVYNSETGNISNKESNADSTTTNTVITSEIDIANIDIGSISDQQGGTISKGSTYSSDIEVSIDDGTASTAKIENGSLLFKKSGLEDNKEHSIKVVVKSITVSGKT